MNEAVLNRFWVWAVFLQVALLVPHQVANALSEDDIGEHCYKVFHEPEGFSEEERIDCRRKLRALPLLVVTPTRTEQNLQDAPAAVSVVTSDDIVRAGPDGIAEALRDVPGVEITDAGQAGQKRIRIRGQEARRVAILIDGQEFLDHREVGTPLLIAPESIDRIEVIRGSGSVLYGSRAIGGVINIITKKGGFHPVQGAVTSSYHSATEGYQTSASLYGSAEGYDYRISGTRAEHGDRDTPDGELENTSFDNWSVSSYLGKRFEKHTVAASFDKYESDSEVFVEEEVRTTPPFTEFQIDAPQRDRWKAAVFYDGADIAAVMPKLHFDAYFQRSERQFNTFSDLMLDFGFPVTRRSDVYNDSQLDSSGANIQADFDLSEAHYLVAGLKIVYDDLEQDRLRQVTDNGAAKPDERVRDEANQQVFEVFVQDEWSITDVWTLTAGARGYFVDSELDKTTREGLSPSSSDDQHVIASVALTNTQLSHTTLWTNFSQGYVYPSLVNLATGAFAGPDFVSPNQDLDPETSNTYEVGARYDNGTVAADVVGFYMDADDYIDHVSCSSTSVACIEPSVGRRDRVYVNIDEAITFGAEGELSVQVKQLKPYGSLTWLRQRFKRDGVKTYDTGVPTVAARVGVEAEHFFSSEVYGWADFFLRTATGADELEDNGEIDEKGGWTTYNISFGADVGDKGQYKLAVDLVNLTDKRYIPATENLLGAGRSAIFSMSAEF